MNTSEGELCLRRKRGVREGATDGPGLFTRGYAKPMKQFTHDVASTEIGQSLTITFKNTQYDVQHLSRIPNPTVTHIWSNRSHAVLKRSLRAF